MREALVVLVCSLALAGATPASHEPATDAARSPSGTDLRIVVVEEWSDPRPASPGTGERLPGALQSAGGQRTRSLVGRVDVLRAATAPARRPGITDLSAPAPRDVPVLRRAIVYLESAPSAAFDPLTPMRARIDQRNETFVPHVLAVTAGSVVDFPNNDRTYHNVFSLSRTKRFDLGRYPQGASRAVRFDRPGIVRVFCDIHSHMSAFVLVFSHPFFATTDADGQYRIDGIPPGRYTVAAWYDGESRAVQQVTLPAGGGPVDLDFLVP